MTVKSVEVSLTGVTKVYAKRVGRGRVQDLTAVQGVNQVVPPGRFVSIIGPSGCGKSTLLRMIAGLQPVSGGVIEIGGSAISHPHPDSAMVFQEDALLPWRTASANVQLPLESRGISRPERERRALDALGVVGLDAFKDSFPREMSGGMRQRVAVARAFVVEPGLLLMDEPFASLDQQTRMVLGTELVRLWEQVRSTVLFVTHDITEAALLSDEVWVMSRTPGRIIETIQVDIPRPRSISSLGDPHFQDLTQRLWKLLLDAGGDHGG